MERFRDMVVTMEWFKALMLHKLYDDKDSDNRDKWLNKDTPAYLFADIKNSTEELDTVVSKFWATSSVENTDFETALRKIELAAADIAINAMKIADHFRYNA